MYWEVGYEMATSVIDVKSVFGPVEFSVFPKQVPNINLQLRKMGTKFNLIEVLGNQHLIFEEEATELSRKLHDLETYHFNVCQVRDLCYKR